jgi:hypothetical protein
MRRAVRIALMAIVAAAVTVWPRRPAQPPGAEACGPYALEYAFARVATPEDPEAYVGGAIGLVQPTFRLPWLVTAYRQLSGVPLKAAAKQALIGPFDEGTPAPPGTVFGAPRWVRARAEALKEPQTYLHIRNDAFDAATGVYYENCSSEAFEAAAATLATRIVPQGDAVVASWVAAQDTVWANCSHVRNAAPKLPAALDASATPVARADRAYQIATATFYAGQWDAAAALFRAIAADRTSPWQPWGDYLAGRALLRKGTLGTADGALDQAALADAAAAFGRVAADPTSPLRASATGLARFVELRRRPLELRADVVARVLAADAGDRFAEDLAEYRYVFLRDEPAGDASPAKGRATVDPLTDWIDTLRSGAPDASAHAVARWRAGRQLPWLVAAMLRVAPGDAAAAELVAAARAVPSTSPAYPSLAFHRARLLVRAGQIDEARALAAEMAKVSGAWPPSAVNALRAIQLRVAPTFEAFLAASQQRAIGFLSEDNQDIQSLPRPLAPALGPDALDILNERLPLSRLIEASRHAAWAEGLRGEARRAAFARALLIDDVEAVATLAPEMRKAYPALAADLDAVRAAATPDERRFVAALLLARNPGLRPFLTSGERRRSIDWGTTPPTITPDPPTELDGLRDNWWCGLRTSPARDASLTTFQAYQPGLYARHGARVDAPVDSLYADPFAVPQPEFVTAAERAQTEKEWTALSTVEGAPDYFGRVVLAWAKAHPDDVRVAEALHRVVRATRLGCTTDASAGVSKAAFTELHRLFPKSEWAKRTPYWFR